MLFLKAGENHLLVKQDFDRLLVNDLEWGMINHIASEGGGAS